jgi:ABC-2 type transport system ATP-binding protein
MEKIIVKDVNKSYGEVHAVKQLSFNIGEGKIYGILGPNGAGKTTTIRMLLNIIPPDSGEILIDNKPFEEKMKEKIGYLPEERGLYRKLKVKDTLCFFGELKGMKPKEALKSAESWIEKIGLSEWFDRKVEELSKGMQQKIQFITSIIHNPDIIIFDEPFSGLDPLNTEILLDIMLEMKKKGSTILFSTHILEHAEKLVDGVTLIKKGENVLTGSLEEIRNKYSANLYKIELEDDDEKIKKFPYIQEFNSFGKEFEIEIKKEIEPTKFLKDIVEAGIKINKFERIQPSLKNIYLKVMKEEEK